MHLSRPIRPVVSIVVLGLGAYFLPAGLGIAGLPVEQMLAIAAAGAIALAAAAARMALMAWRQAVSIDRRLLHFAQLVDGSLREAEQRAQRQTAALSLLREQLRQEPPIATADRQAETDRTDRPDRPVLVAANDQRAGADIPISARVDVEALARLAPPLRRAAAGDLAISLQSILPARGTPPVACEVYFRLHISAAEPQDFRRLPGDLTGIEPASFERLLLVRSAEAARAFAVSRRSALPLHVAVSEALLSSGREFAAVLGMLTDDPPLADMLVFSLPSACLAADGGHAQALELLASEGVRFACEGPLPAAMTEAVGAAVLWVKIPAEALLSHPKLPETNAGTLLIATAVESESEVGRLDALGVPLMTGHAVSGPCLAALPEPSQAGSMVNRI